ncbi:hypothetical protein TDB9533_00504 [Thalassocella blandensis]|nr:hypothetical protein TDB9533_00504 [Thalassocella blandensis]
MDRKVAFFIDGNFYIKRLGFFARKYFSSRKILPQQAIYILRDIIHYHESKCGSRDRYRSYYYDAPPLDVQQKFPLPLPGHRTPPTKNFKSDPNYVFQHELHKHLGEERKMALRMGKLSNHRTWQIKSPVLTKLIKKEIEFDSLTNDDFYLDVRQKGVDTRIGMDITYLTLRGFVDTIILIASDADFVPVAKLARTNGVDVIIDPLHADTVDKDLLQHIDGRHSCDLVSELSKVFHENPSPRPAWWKSSQTTK